MGPGDSGAAATTASRRPAAVDPIVTLRRE